MKKFSKLFLSIVLWIFLAFVLKQSSVFGGDFSSPPGEFFILGGQTNMLRAGVFMERADQTFVMHKDKGTKVQIAIYNTSTNDIVFYVRKDLRQWFEMTLMDSNGVIVSKTAKGDLFTSPMVLVSNTPVVNWKAGGFIKESVSAKRDRMWDLVEGPSNSRFDLATSLVEYFQLKDSGDYTLYIAQRVYLVNGNNVLEPLTLPPAKIRVRFEPK